jgi:Na+/H+-translocating membrane pyrophosphatase
MICGWIVNSLKSLFCFVLYAVIVKFNGEIGMHLRESSNKRMNGKVGMCLFEEKFN